MEHLAMEKIFNTTVICNASLTWGGTSHTWEPHHARGH